MDIQAKVEEEIERQREYSERIAKEVMTELWAKLPFGHSFRLSDGSQATFSDFGGPRQDEEGWSLTLDAKIKGGGLDHLELTVRVTGGGMSLITTSGD